MLDDKQIKLLIENGDHWKAKEKLQGRLTLPGYDAELFEAYGYVLLKMNDKVEAGKYLFLSGERSAEYAESIDLYLNRYARKGSNHLFNTFPKQAQSAPFSKYPENVMAELGRLEFKPKEIINTRYHRHEKSRSDRLVEHGCLTLLLAAFVIFVFGFVTGINQLVDLLL